MDLLSAAKSGMKCVLEVSECVSPILQVASALYDRYNEVKANKKRCGRLVDRVKVIEDIVRDVTNEDLDNNLVRRALRDLENILTDAEKLVGKHADTHWLKRSMEANSLKVKFDELNSQLSEVSDQLSQSLQLEELKQLKKLREVFEVEQRKREDLLDAEADQQEWQRVLLRMDEKIDNMHDGIQNAQSDISEIKIMLQSIQREGNGTEYEEVDRIQSNIQKSDMNQEYETLISQYKTHIQDKFGKVKEYNSRPGADYVVMSERYIDLVIVQKHREQREREREIRVRGKELYQVFARASKEYLCITVEQLFSPDSKGEVPKAVILQGHSGYGKSFTAQKIMDDWASDRIYRDTFDLVFHLKVKELNNIKDNLSLVDLLLYDEIDKATVLKVLQETPQRVLFLIDGFDELFLSPEDTVSSLPSSPGTRGKVRMVLAALLSGRMLRKSSLLVTTRSTALKALSDMLKHPQRFTEILGFSVKGMENYFKAFFAKEEDPEVWRKALKHVKDNETLLTACFIPVTCWIICNVFSDMFKKDAGMLTGLDTSTSIFAHFVFTQMRHHGRDLDKTEWNNLLKDLGELAMDGIMKQKVLFEESDVHQMVSNHSLVPFLCKFFLRKINIETKYSFMHLSFQEFFAALFYLLSDPDVALRNVDEMLTRVQLGLNVTDQKLHMSHLLPVIQFLFGLSNKEVTASHQLSASSEIRSLLEGWICNLIEAEDGLPRTHNIQLFILQCLYEAHEEDILRKAMEMWNRINLDGIPLKKTDCSVLAYCVRHCQAMERLTLTHCNLTGQKLELLTEALGKSAELGLVVEELTDGDVGDLTTALGERKIVTDLHLKNSSLSLSSLLQVLDALAIQKQVDTVDLHLRIPYKSSTAMTMNMESENSATTTTIEDSGEDVCDSWNDTPLTLNTGLKTDGLLISLQRQILSTEPLECKHTITLGLGQKVSHLGPCVSEISISQSASSECFRNTWTHLLETVHTLGDSPASFAEQVDALQSSLCEVPDVKVVELVLGCLTVDVATKFLSFFQACPTLQSGRCKQSKHVRGAGEALCSDLSLRKTSTSLQLTLKHCAGEITLTVVTPSEESDWTKVFQKLSSVSGSPACVNLSFLHQVSGLQRVMLQVSCLTERWAAALLSLIQTPPTLPLEYCSLRVNDLPTGNNICSFLSVEKEDDNITLVVEYNRQLSPLTEVQITDVLLIMPPSDMASFHFQHICTLRDLDQGTPEFVEHVSSVPGLQKIKLTISCLTGSWAETICTLIKACPTLVSIMLDAGEGGERLLLEEGIQSLQDGLQSLKASQSRPQLTLKLTGRRCDKDSAPCTAPADWELNCNRRVQLRSCGLEGFTNTHLEHQSRKEEEEEEDEEEVREHMSLMNPQQGPRRPCSKDCLCRCELQ